LSCPKKLPATKTASKREKQHDAAGYREDFYDAQRLNSPELRGFIAQLRLNDG
jgi:hypothetical protein